MWRLIGLIGLILGLSFSVQAQSVDAQAAEIVQLVNSFRAQKGLPPLTYNATLATAAQQQTEYISATNRYTHSGYSGSTPQTRANAAGYIGRVSENIVGGSDMTPSQGLAWWINSPVHYNTLITTYYTEIGGGFSTGTLNQRIYAIVVGTSGGTTSSPAPANRNAAPIVAPAFNMASPDEDGAVVHIVKSGQAMWTLAAYYDVELDYIYRINNLSENAFISAGDEIVVRLADGVPTPTPLPTPTPPFEHIVQRGQTLWTIAALHSLTIDELLYLNSITENSFISPGDELIVHLRPGQSPPPTATPQLTHTIRSGQGLWGIAIAYGLTLEELLAFNDLTENSILQPGQELFIRQPAESAVVTVEATVVVTATASADPTPTTPSTSIIQTVPPDPSQTDAAPSPDPSQTPSAEPTATATPQPVPAMQPTNRLSRNLQMLIMLGAGVAIFGAVGLFAVLRRQI
ncbi:MAG: LysM peptidoglycan-binding domain-containing protein [Candidatus Promineifilaceae bacterium]